MPAQPLHCLHYIDGLRLEEGGVVRSVLDLTATLACGGIEVTILTGDATDAPNAWKSSESSAKDVPRVIEINRATLPWKRSAADRRQLTDAISQADVVHVHTPWDPFNLTVATAARRAGKPYVVSTHGMLDDWCIAQHLLKKRLYLATVGRKMLERAGAIHFTAEGERAQAIKWAPRAETAVLPLIIDLSSYANLPGPNLAIQKFPTPPDEPRLLFLSRVNYKKGIDLLIEAVALLAERGRPTHAIIAGPADPGYAEQLQAIADRRGVTKRIHFVGMVRDKTKLSLYESADLFVLPTSQENFGIVFAEALACRLPLISTRGVDIWPELERMGGAIIDRSAEAFADTIGTMLDDPEGTAERGNRGREETLAWLDPARLTKEYVALYECLVANSR